MKNYFLILLAFLLVAGISCQEKVDTKSDEEAVRNWMNQYVANNNAGDFENFRSFWTEDVIWMPPGTPILIGKTAALDFAQPFFSNYTIAYKATVEEVRVINDFAYLRASVIEKYTPITGDTEPMVMTNKNIFLFRKESDGSWAATHCIWNNNSPSSQYEVKND